MPPSVRVTFFAQAREAVGHRALVRRVPPEGQALRILLRDLGAEYPRLVPVLRSCRFARNSTYVDDDATVLVGGDELGIHPPYSGG